MKKGGGNVVAEEWEVAGLAVNGGSFFLFPEDSDPGNTLGYWQVETIITIKKSGSKEFLAKP